MPEILYEFKQGPYDVLNFKVKKKDEKAIIEINDGNLGRLPIENIETVQKLREALDSIEAYLKEVERRKEEL